jgi:putative flippase GtrA
MAPTGPRRSPLLRLLDLWHIRFSRFLVVGVLAAVVDFGTFNVVLLLGDERSADWIAVANTAAVVVAFLFSYSMQSRVTFRAGWSWTSMILFIVVTVIGIGVYNGGLLGLRAIVQPDAVLVLNFLKLLAAVPLLIWKYVGFSQIAFRGVSAGGGPRASA